MQGRPIMWYTLVVSPVGTFARKKKRQNHSRQWIILYVGLPAK